MPILTDYGRWVEDTSLSPDIGFLIGLVSPHVREQIHALYNTWLTGQFFVAKTGLVLTAASFYPFDATWHAEDFAGKFGLSPYELEVMEGVTIDGYIFTTSALLAYFTYRVASGSDNPANYRRTDDGVWRRDS